MRKPRPVWYDETHRFPKSKMRSDGRSTGNILWSFFRRHWTWLIAALSIAGVVLNVLQRSECFVIWIFTNAVWVIVDWRKGIYPQAAIFAVYFALSIWGLITWMA